MPTRNLPRSQLSPQPREVRSVDPVLRSPRERESQDTFDPGRADLRIAVNRLEAEDIRVFNPVGLFPEPDQIRPSDQDVSANPTARIVGALPVLMVEEGFRSESPKPCSYFRSLTM